MRGIISITLILAAIGIFIFYTNGVYQNTQVLSAQTSDYGNALNESKNLMSQRDSLNNQYDQIQQTDLDRIQKMLPDSVDNVRLIIDINGIANKFGLTIKNLQVGSGDGGTLGPNNNPYGSISLSFTVSSSYSAFQEFLQSLEQSLRLVDITSVTFTSTDKSNIYDFNVTLQTYWLKQTIQ